MKGIKKTCINTEEADAFLLNVGFEGWGRVVLKQGASLAGYMTDVGLAQEIIKNNESGFIIPVGDERNLFSRCKSSGGLNSTRREGALKAFKALPKGEEQIRKQVEEWNVLTDRK